MNMDDFYKLVDEVVDNAVSIQDNGNKYIDANGNIFIECGMGARHELTYNGHTYFLWSEPDGFWTWHSNYYIYDCEKKKIIYEERGPFRVAKYFD